MDTFFSLIPTITDFILLLFCIHLSRQIERSERICCEYTDAMNLLLSARIDALEKGISPDYDKAKEAANALNAFNDSINAILGYDPYKAIRQKDGDND